MIQQHREVCLAVANRKLPTTFREDLIKVESALREIATLNKDAEFDILANSAKSLRDGLVTRDATTQDWSQFTSTLREALQVKPPAATVLVDLSAFSESDMKAILSNPELQDAIRTKKTLLNYQGAIQSLPNKQDTASFKVLRVPIIPIADGYANHKILSRPPLKAVDLDGRYFVLPNQLVVAINTNKVLTSTPMVVPVFSTEKMALERDNLLRKKAAIAEAKASIAAMRADTKTQLIKDNIAEYKKQLHASMKKKLEAEVAVYAAAETEKFNEKIASMVEALTVPEERKTKKAKQIWLDEAQDKIEQLEMPRLTDAINAYRQKLGAKYKAQFTKDAAVKEASIRDSFVKPTADMKKQMFLRATTEIEKDFANQLQDAIAELKTEIAEAKQRNKETRSPSSNTANRINAVVAAMEHKLGENLSVMDGVTKYKSSGYLYYWVVNDRTLNALKAGFNGSFTASQWGFPF